MKIKQNRPTNAAHPELVPDLHLKATNEPVSSHNVRT